MVSVLITSITIFIILLSVGTRRMFSIKIFLSRDITNECNFPPVHRPFVLPCFVGGVFVACCLVGIDCLMVLKMSILSGSLTGNSLIDDTNGSVHALVICCGPVTTFAGSEYLFCISFGTEFLAVGCLVLNSIGTLLLWF